MKMRLCLVFISSLLFSFAHGEPAYLTFPSDIEWKQKDSPHFHCLYRAGFGRFADQTLEYAEKAHTTIDSIFPEGPEKTWIVIADHLDALNGYAITFPFPHMVIYAYPPHASSQLVPLDNWHFSVVLHEYVHIRHLYPANGLWKAARAIFGSVIAPNGMMPSHLHEGIATFIETNFTQGGRGTGSPFQMYLRKAVEAGVWGSEFAPLDLYDGSPSRWPGGASPYFFGYLTYAELWRTKGKDGLLALTEDSSRNWPYFINSPLESVYGLDYATLWRKIYADTQGQAEKDLQRLREKPLSGLKYLTQTRFHKKELLLSPDGSQIAFRHHSPVTDNQLEIIDTKTQATLNRYPVTPSPGDGACWLKHGEDTAILYLGNEAEAFYQTSVLTALNPKTGEVVLLPANLRELTHVHSLQCDESGKRLWVVESQPGQIKLRRFVAKDSLMENVTEEESFSFSGPVWISALVPGSLGYFFLKSGTDTFFYRWGQGEPEAIGKFSGTVLRARAKSDDELYLVAGGQTSDSVWRFFPTQRKLQKRVAVTGGISEFLPLNGKGLVLSYEHGGYDLAEAAFINGEAQTLSAAGPLRPENPPSYPDYHYSPWDSLAPKAWVPSLLFVPTGVQLGAWIPAFDVAQRHFFDAYLGYDSRGLPFGLFNYGHRFGGYYQLNASVNFTPSYLVSSRSFFKRWGGELGWEMRVPHTGFSFGGGPVYKKVETSRLGPARQSVGWETNLVYRRGLRSRPQSIGPGTGIKMAATHQLFFDELGSQEDYFTTILGWDGYWESPFVENSLWYLGTRFGYTEGTPLYNSYFEAGGEMVFSQGKGTFLNRGYLNGYFVGSRVFNANLEYRFPMLTVERGHGFFPAFLNRIHGAVVADVTSLDFGVRSRLPRDLMKVFYVSAGVELKTDWKWFYYLPSLVRLGAYHGFTEGGEALYFTLGIEASL